MMRKSAPKLTRAQSSVLSVMEGRGEMRTGEIGRRLGMDGRYIANYLGGRLMGLYRRGLIQRTLKGRVAYWTIDPYYGIRKIAKDGHL